VSGRTRAGLACAAALWIVLAAGAAHAATGARARFDRALRGTNDARATFTQTTAGALGPVVTQGTFEYARPRHVRMTWTGAVAATAYVVLDTLWYDAAGQGAVVRGDARAVGVPAGLFVGGSLAELERSCRVVEAGAGALRLTPLGDGAAWTSLALVLDPASGWPRTATLVTRDGTVTRLAFGRYQVNRGIAPARLAPHFAPARTVVPMPGAPHALGHGGAHGGG
jgi:outer membrane lipoprotein-sorting protein